MAEGNCGLGMSASHAGHAFIRFSSGVFFVIFLFSYFTHVTHSASTSLGINPKAKSSSLYKVTKTNAGAFSDSNRYQILDTNGFLLPESRLRGEFISVIY
jgi:hypothetical protein